MRLNADGWRRLLLLAALAAPLGVAQAQQSVPLAQDETKMTEPGTAAAIAGEKPMPKAANEWEAAPPVSHATHMRGKAGLAGEQIQQHLNEAREAYTSGRQQAAANPLQSVLFNLRSLPGMNTAQPNELANPAATELQDALADLDQLAIRLSRNEVARSQELTATFSRLYTALSRYHYERAFSQVYPGAAGRSPATAAKGGNRDFGDPSPQDYRVGIALAPTTQTTPVDMPNPAWRITLQDHVRQAVKSCEARLSETKQPATPALAETMGILRNWSRVRPPLNGAYITTEFATALRRFGTELRRIDPAESASAATPGDVTVAMPAASAQ